MDWKWEEGLVGMKACQKQIQFKTDFSTLTLGGVNFKFSSQLIFTPCLCHFQSYLIWWEKNNWIIQLEPRLSDGLGRQASQLQFTLLDRGRALKHLQPSRQIHGSLSDQKSLGTNWQGRLKRLKKRYEKWESNGVYIRMSRQSSA